VLTHFVVDTGRNGRGRLAVAPYAVAPYNQPASVINGLRSGDWCNPPGAGLGLRPTANTGVPLVDAFLWVSSPLGPGGSDASCDIAGGSRDWDYSKYNPWGITSDGQKHFDPLWGMVDPPMGEWFPEQALQLARNADPPLQGTPTPQLAQGADAPAPAAANDRAASVADVGRYAGARPTGRRRISSAQPSPLPASTATSPASPAPVGTTPAAPITFDQQNPYK
jgi:cellulase/cellobiase CelA1